MADSRTSAHLVVASDGLDLLHGVLHKPKQHQLEFVCSSSSSSSSSSPSSSSSSSSSS
eukprot:CAMPEP_0115304006 /NCGR_PEP_ID=MMETSP0270-20121206/71225_1 /TAXON_ID=71861 /ORGANISM="Scrippsiella trochoidea, Strain CCMP3099" /LENGTH=57 /DNA_ID=CAMNT_0002722049 /DNA_START=46 /DNA_END=215 /DNA_ORIENTATION=+